MRLLPCLALAFSLLLPATAGAAAISVIDDAGSTVALQQPARRIIALSPHAAELIHAAGAGHYLVGAAEHSDYPPVVSTLPSVGGSAALDMERILALKPDLIVAWDSGNSARQLAKLQQLGFPLYRSEPRSFESIAASLERLGRLAGTEATGQAQAEAFRQRRRLLASRYQDSTPVSVFYQVWRAPLMTLNDAHLVSEAIRLCGGRNVFGHLAHLAPTVSMEAVIEADPQAIIATGEAERDPFAGWRRFLQLKAVRHNHLFLLDASLITRPGPRILEGTAALCSHLEAVRR